MNNSISDAPVQLGEAIRFAWQKFKDNWMLILQIMIIGILIGAANEMVKRVLSHSFIGGLATLVLTIADFVLGVGSINIALKLVRGQSATINDLILSDWHVFVRYIVAIVLLGALIGIGIILLIIPGVYLMLRFAFVQYSIIDGYTISEALKHSTALTQGIKWQLLWVYIAVIVLNILGGITVIGLLFTLPITVLALAHIYVRLSEREMPVVEAIHGDVPPVTESTHSI